ncbi:2Fe-2S iron-sulfur cluster binding domain-containing protein [Sphingomonas sp. HF-S4]|uniref:2Fe-2S iron-sulfur cluster binding domain-containing protein n=1 Tax=Sphingomonas agrestis TaxID=3080540 RepID=A0ABU3Y1W8_9SPHN|nr:2Fe-2S iron-sulfur cluster binding domain-containing protein [Sphingomonas sp. HF-S4]MDV3455371.1 2Fe-2S iron-sulfur cluster binding domain-containing protein [Sphingomonas sp. HF-S4]
MFRATLQFQDGGSFELAVPDGQTLVEAAIEADAPLRSDCMSGTCGSCIARCAEGRVAREVMEMPIVSADEAAAGIYPTCLTRLESDARFELDYPLAPRPSDPGRHRGELLAIDRLAASVSRLTIRLESPEDFRFQPGQYLRLRPPGLRAARAYSIASAPGALPLVELLIRHVPGGQVSDWLESEAAVPGATMTLQGPLGGFALDDRATRAVFVAGGTGLAPSLAMIRANAGRMPMLLCFGCTRREELFLHEELRALEAGTPGLEVRIALMEGAAGDVREGTAVALLAGDPVAGASYHLCGPPGMVDAARVVLRAEGVAPERIRAERFAVGG